MFRLLLIVAIIATIPFLIYSGMRRRLLSAISATATVYLVLIGISYLARIPFFTQQLQDTIGAIVIVTFVAVAGYTVVRFYADRAGERKLRDRRKHPEAHRSLLDNLRRTLKI